MKTLTDIRSSFLNYFGNNAHEVVASSPLVPHNDPTLMFANAGMNQFKNVFTGLEQRNYSRAASSQKCVRAGGKHNDLENVGYTARHHTFFEMLGNFSFGDYFKEQAIFHAWQLLTKEWALPPEKLYVTIYHDDEEAFGHWKKISGFADSKIIRIATADNFWSMGDTGPCGPSSEIFYDHGAHIAGGLPGTADQDGDRFIEIWNLVFMQYETLADGSRISLPKPSIDTGMGLERVASVLQGVHNNYDTDLFKTLIAHSTELTKGGEITSHRVIADHLRSACFLIADGVMPSNEGRGYVLRRIMRRAMRHLYHLGTKEATMHKLVNGLVKLMGDAYPELTRAQSLITEVIRSEEERFRETLGRGIKLLEDETAKISGNILAGEVAFKLYDTYGFPLDLTADILRSQGKKVDEDGFNTAMAMQKARAKAAWKGSGEKATDEVWFDILQEHGATEFLGYDATQAQAKVVAVVQQGDDVLVVTNQTPFYAESGGQIGDSGFIRTTNHESRITDTKKMLGSLHVHYTKAKDIKIGDTVTLKIDVKRRDAIRANHSATHILHKVLRDVLGEHVTQKGSLVRHNGLRFDFSHNGSLEEGRIMEIEQRINYKIFQNDDVVTKLMTPENAIKEGAMALFGEKYGDEVRVLSMGDSVELCGGTHVKSTGDIGFFKITSEAAIAAGIRRIEAITGLQAVAYIQQREYFLDRISEQLKVAPADVIERIEQLQNNQKKLEKEISDLRKKSVGDLTPEIVNGINFIGKKLEGLGANETREIAENLRKAPNTIIALFGVDGGKISIVTAVSDDLKDKFKAPDLVKIASEATGGKGGGGKPEIAQAGGADAGKVDEALAQITSAIK